jgi:anthranilate synthase/aminodeoxychorismate synthase-like glutamine amidotransferase
MRVLMVDNYDSFTYNLVHLLEALGAEVVVRRSDDVTLEDARSLAPDRLVVSPGPGRPAGAGRSVELIIGLAETTPTLGVCLGHQAIVEAYGGEVAGAKELLHGKASLLRHDGRGVFAGLPPTIEAGRYHSLAAIRIPPELEVSASAADGEVMGVRHRSLPVEGVQFHPESVLTPEGPEMLRNFLRSDGAKRRDTDHLGL